jgi:hypothetical protein
MGSKGATITKQTEAVTSQDVFEHMCVDRAKDRNLSVNVRDVPVQTPLNYDAGRYALRHHTDPEYVSFILDGIQNGVNIGHEGHTTPVISDNWPSAYTFRDVVETSIHTDIQRGRKLGPYDTPPLPETFVGSPMGAFEKKHSTGKYRIIHDLSWPPGNSVNENITIDCSVHYQVRTEPRS